MTFQLPDDSTPFGKSVRRRVHEEYLIWLTTVDTREMPQPAPVWFWWDEDASNFLVYNLAHARRLDAVCRNSQVALHFNGYGTGSGIMVFTGHAQISTSEPPADQHLLYLAKYHHWMTSKFGSPEQFAAEYSVALRIHPVKVRGSSS
ncbi:MAG: TIGR03667 family PPOX class F420-dependent oxidoreductase [Ktedonobacteraceae bacterium]|nr:TIGR03667 family PPOX class F420-dependent oxidoreductase [Ktedonobacteraceae bacterium]